MADTRWKFEQVHGLELRRNRHNFHETGDQDFGKANAAQAEASASSMENQTSPLDTAEFYGSISIKEVPSNGLRRGRGILRLRRIIQLAIAMLSASGGTEHSQQHIGSTVLAKNDVTRELSGASAPLTAGENVFRNEIVKTGVDSTAKLVFLDSTNLGVGPTSRVTLDQFVNVGETNGQKMAVNLVKGVFRFTTGKLDKNAYIISTPSASIGVRGTVLDIGAQSGQSKVTLVEGQALVCPRRPGITFAQQVRNCTRAAGGSGGPRCERVDLNDAGQTALVKKSGGSNQASLTSTPVNFASNCAGDASLCSGARTRPQPPRAAEAAFQLALCADDET